MEPCNRCRRVRAARSAAYGVNDSGTVVGYGDLASGLFRAVVWQSDGSTFQLGTLGGANSYAAAVNDAGQVVGHSEIASGYDHAFLASNGILRDLGTLDGGCSYAYGINNGGAVVGYSWSETANNPRAFVYTGGVMEDLNALITAGSGWQLYEAYAINDLGEITGIGSFDGQVSAFLLQPTDPVPEPRGLSVILLALGVFVANFLRSRMRYRG
jgi:probable HAF family extracellular repeat protein